MQSKRLRSQCLQWKNLIENHAHSIIALNSRKKENSVTEGQALHHTTEKMALNRKIFHFSQFLSFFMLCLCSNHTALYCKPLDECWPNETAWNLLSENLGVAEFDGKNKVRKISSLDLEEEYEACIAAGDDAYALSGMLAFFQWHSISDHFIIFLLILPFVRNSAANASRTI